MASECTNVIAWIPGKMRIHFVVVEQSGCGGNGNSNDACVSSFHQYVWLGGKRGRESCLNFNCSSRFICM